METPEIVVKVRVDTREMVISEDNRERRFQLSTVKTSSRAENEARRIEGYAAMFNAETTIGYGAWGFREVIRPGAFKRAAVEDDVRALFNHDPNLILGRNKAQTLELSEDERGLLYRIIPPDTTYARDLMASIERGDVTDSSFSFIATKETWTDPPPDSRELPLREIQEAELFDVAPVVYPAYDATSVSMNAQRRSEASREKIEAALRARGLGEAQAREVYLRMLLRFNEAL